MFVVKKEQWRLFTNMASNVYYLCLSSEQLFLTTSPPFIATPTIELDDSLFGGLLCTT
jgi:hypothetical protein